MRIGTIYTIYNGRGGVEFFFERIVKEITRTADGVEFTVFCNKQAFNILKHCNGLKCILVGALNNQCSKFIWLELFSKKYINKHNIDLFWLPSGANSFPGKWGIPVVTTIHDIGEFHIKNKYDFVRFFYRTKICIPRSLKRSNKIVSVSNFSAFDIKRTLNYNKDISVIYEAPDPWSEGKIVSHADIIKRETGMILEKIILCVGRTHFIGKGIDVILKGYSRALVKGGLNSLPPLVFVGPKSEESPSLQYFIKKFKMGNKVFYLGNVSNSCLESLYSVAIVNILASRYEGFGMTVLEALKRGIPVLCSDLPVLREISGNAPVFFKTGDSIDFADKLSDILNGKRDLKFNIESGFNISSKYNWEKTTKGYLNIFKEFLLS